MLSKHFIRLEETLHSLTTDPATAHDPIKRMFVCDGEHVSANVSILEDTGDALHIQSLHDELVLILEGECGFRVGNEVQRVRTGDLIFIPKDTIHGSISDSGRIATVDFCALF